VLVSALIIAGCMVGPAYRRPAAPLAAAWTDRDAEGMRTDTPAAPDWWGVFGDATLDDLVTSAYRQNLTLQAAGLRVLEAQALRGIAIGTLFPQTQEVTASVTRQRNSLATGVPGVPRYMTAYQTGFDAAWELDLWGRFRRGIEASDAQLLAAVADYDDVLVSLVAEVASNYVQLRVLEARLVLARDNVRVQRDSLEIARVRFEAGGTSDLDVQQATALLRDTEATIPQLETQFRQSGYALAVLLGVPPSDLPPLSGEVGAIPVAPAAVTVGIPADLLRRRPDVRRVERQLAAQSARIGVAAGDLFPRLTLAGSVGLSADTAAHLAAGNAFTAFGGPQLVWPVLNYGRLINEVRVQDATFQELVAAYGDTVLRAQQDVENALVGYARGAEQVARLFDAVAAANRAVELSLIQYREGAADYTRVLTTQQAKLREDDSLASARGTVTLEVIALYKAVGGGWELRDGEDFVPAPTKDAMRRRTWWGGILNANGRAVDIDAATPREDGAARHRWWSWWPHW
jgi:NodT family efflux transporter outer membrane factor (OMF) lipoprotein